MPWQLLLHDAKAEVRRKAALVLGQLGKTTAEVITGLLEVLRKAKEQSSREDAARLLSEIGQGDQATLDAFWYGLLDKNNNVREVCAQALAGLGRKSQLSTQKLGEELFKLFRIEFEKIDEIEHRPAFDYAYEGLWLLMSNDETEA